MKVVLSGVGMPGAISTMATRNSFPEGFFSLGIISRRSLPSGEEAIRMGGRPMHSQRHYRMFARRSERALAPAEEADGYQVGGPDYAP
jgi:hypothetical protein